MAMANNLILNRLFTIAAFQQLIEKTNTGLYSEIINRYTNAPDGLTNAEAISEIYRFMRKQYRNEYYYKNTVLNRLLLGVHSINTTTALTEIPISTSKADFILINGKAVVYEIKTELDNLDRLNDQIKNYFKAFSRVCVITCDEYAQILLKRYENTDVGIYTLSSKENIHRLKEPTEKKENLDMEVIFKILNKHEFEHIIKRYYGELPVTTQVKYYSACKKLFCDIPRDCAYDLFLKMLKSRNKVSDVCSFENVPNELKSLVYFSHYSKADYKRLDSFLSSSIIGG